MDYIQFLVHVLKLQHEKQNAMITQQKILKQRKEQEFRQKSGMTDEEYASFVTAAKNHQMTLDDVAYVLNRDKNAANVANSTKKDMLNQMKSVRNMPTSAAGANSQGGQQSADSSLFDGLLGLDDSVDKLFE